jgi:methyl-accepting chemotaxis protein
VQEINGSINTMDEMTQQNSALVEQSSAAARSLSDQAGNLTELMDFFKLEGSTTRLPSRTASPRPAQPSKSTRPAPALATSAA